MSGITTHVLDTSRGKPAAAVPIVLHVAHGSEWIEIGRGVTDSDGRLRTLVSAGLTLERAAYRLVFETGAYFRAQGVEGFFPSVQIDFMVRDPAQHHHVPLLLSPFGYSTYRGS